MSNAFDATAINYRVGSVATNAVKSIREVYGRDHLPFLDADSAAIKAIESVLMSVPVHSLNMPNSKQSRLSPAINQRHIQLSRKSETCSLERLRSPSSLRRPRRA